ncbi:AAA family ATPase [Brumimicrobium mesophilum]|uniref:AAA family ATPase n=1 Tax=Brumimicrobium mesophilum TaxID=392717 RepID=UPI00131B01EF|nr:ATP-binding protein [Brumimicrobium mesophilum]
MKITFTGPESSGKSTISKAVAEHLDAQWFPEHAREYLLKKNGKYEFGHIEQIAINQEIIRNANAESGLKIYDTENIVLYIWSTFKYNKCDESVQKLMENQRFSHYFLCSPEDIPWEDDPLRENPNQREELFELYLAELKKLNADFTILKGNFEERKEKAISIIEELSLSKGGFCV